MTATTATAATSQQPPRPTATSKQTRTGTKYPVRRTPPQRGVSLIEKGANWEPLKGRNTENTQNICKIQHNDDSLNMRLAYRVLTSIWKEYSFWRSRLPSVPRRPPTAILRRSCMAPSSLSCRMATFEIYPRHYRSKVVGHCIILVHIVQIFVDIANSLYIACKNRRFSSQSSTEVPSASRSPLDASGTLLSCPGVSWSLSEHPLKSCLLYTSPSPRD